jgi:hypothetical protein
VGAALFVSLFWAACCLVPGVPIALALDGRRATDAARIALDGLVLGLAWLLLTSLALIRAGHFGPRPLTFLAVLTAAAGLAIAVRRGGLPRRVTRPSAVGAVIVATVLAVAIALRAAPSYFIFMTGDMGEYVNAANGIGRGAGLDGGFPHGMTALFAASNRLLGVDQTVAILPFVGVVLVAVVFGIAREAGVALRPAALVAAATAIGVAPVWFSRFPVSETPFATVIGCSIYLLAAAHHRDNRALAVAGGLLFLPLGIIRGNVAVDAVAVAVYGLIRCLTQPAPRAAIDRWFTVSAIGGAGLGILYDIEYIPDYMKIVLEDNLGTMYGTLTRAEVITPGPISTLTVLVATAVAAAVLWGLGRLDLARRRPAAAARLAAAAPAALLVLTMLVIAALMSRHALQDSADRYGVLLLALGALAVVFAPRSGAAGAVVLYSVTIGAAGSLLYAKRVSLPANHAYYLYPDRYLFGEGFPPAAALAVIGCGIAAAFVARHPRLLVAALLAAVAGLAQLVPATVRSSAHAQIENGYGQVSAMAALTSDRAPIVYAGIPAEQRTGFFFPNTYRAYALPLELSFGRAIVNVDGNLPPFGPDPAPTFADAARLLAAGAATHGWFIREVPAAAPVEPAPAAGTTTPYTARRVSRIDGTVWLLRKRVRGESERWLESRLAWEVWDLRTATP